MADLEQLDPLDPEAYSWGEADAATKAQVSTATAPVTGDMLTSSAIQARFSSATAPVTSDEMIGAYVGTPVMTDADAAREWEAYPYYDEDQRRLADAKFDVFFDRQDKVRERENYDVLKNQLLNPDAKKAFYQSPEALDIAQRLKNPNDLWNQRVVTNFLENVMKRPLEEGEYEGAKNKWIAQGMNGQFEIDDAGAVSTLTKQMELDGEQGEAGVEAHKEIMLGLAEELLGGKPYQIGDTFDKLRKGHPEVFRNRESSMYQSVYDEAEKIKSLIGRNPDAVRLPLSYLIKAESQLMAPEEELKAARNALLNVSPEDRQIVLDFVVDAAKAKLVDPGDLKRGMRELGDVGRGITNSLDDLNQLKDELATHEKMGAVKEGHARVAPDGQWVYTPVAAVAGLRVPTSKESAEQLSELVAEQNFIKASRDLKGAYRRAMKLGTVANEDWLGGVPAWLERGTVGFAANLPNMALYALGGPIGTIGYTLTVGSSYANDALLKNPRMDARVAAAGGWLGAAAEGYFELINWKMFTGGVELKQLYTTLKSSGLEVMLKKLTGQFLGEQGVEGIQDFTGAATMKFVQLIARDLGMGEDQTGKIETWQKIVKDWWEERPEVMGQVLIGSLIGAGIMTHEHLKDPDRTLYNERTLAGTWQMSPEQIDKILNAPSKEARDKTFMRYAQSMTDEQVAASIVYQQDQVQQATGAAISTDENPRATLATEMVDGKRVWHVLDENGERVRENLPADVALTELSAYQELIDKERFEERAREETAVSEVQKQAGAEIVWEALKPEQKTTAQNILEFSYAEKTPEQEAKLARLQEAVNARTERLGIPGDEIEFVDVDQPATRAGRGAVNFIRWYEGTFGKSVQFVASKTDQPLSFTGLTLPSDPNTIFLDAQGDRNILSLLGHEWSHTLEHSNPALWGSIVTQLKPLVVDWAKQLGKISPTYTADQVTPEFIANVIGDAFSTPEFWETLRAKEPNIFKRMVEAIMEWFDVQIDRASEWGTEAPDVISDLKAMREIIANAMKEAQKGPEVITAKETPFAQTAARRGHKFTERGEREVDEKGGYIERAEKDLITQKIHAWLDEKKVPAGAYRDKLVRDTRRQVESDIKSRRALNPDASTGAADPWSRMDVTGVEMEFVTAKEGEKPLTKGGAAWQKQSYQFEKPPEGFTPETWRGELARRVMGQFITQLQTGEKKDVALIVRELEWYRDFTDRLRADFGGAAEFMVDLMGAFSPRQNVQLNWRNAIDAIWGISTGKYDVLLKELDAYLKADPAHTIKTWQDQGGAVIRARSGALMGTNTDLGMTAALGLWREIKFGDAPKAKNFTRNLIGLSIKATIDVWAARLLDRVGGKPRIPVDAEKGVQGKHIVSERQLWKEFGPEYLGELPVKGQFAFGQGVFEDVATMMRDPATWAGTGIPQEIVDAFANVTPADVQATNWFVEKRIWTKNNWTNEEGAGGSFIHEIENLVGSRFQVGLSQAIGNRPGYADFVPTDPDQARFTAEIRQDLINRLPDVISMRVKDSLGMFMDTRERSTDLELTHGPGMEPNDLMRTVLYHAWSKEQQSTHISRIMDPWEEDRSNARPGLEIYFKEAMEERVIQPILDLLGTRDINGFTFIVDPRAEMGEGRYLGVRFQYIPEYSGDGPEWTRNAEGIRTKLQEMHREILMMPGVATVRQEEYDTVVFQEGIDYDADGVNAGAVGTSQAALWRRRYFDAVALKATYRNEAELAAERLAAESDILNRQQSKEAKGLAPPKKKKGKAQVTITAFDPALMGFAEQSVTPSVTLLHQLRAERDAYNALLKCLSS